MARRTPLVSRRRATVLPNLAAGIAAPPATEAIFVRHAADRRRRLLPRRLLCDS